MLTGPVWKTNERVQAMVPDSLRTTPRNYYRRPASPTRLEPISPLRRALRRNPRLPQARIMLAEALEAQNRLLEALVQFRR